MGGDGGRCGEMWADPWEIWGERWEICGRSAGDCTRQPDDGEQRAVRAAEHLDEVVRVLEVVPHEEAHEARPRHAHREGAVGQVAVARVLLAGAQRAARRAEVARLARRHDVAQAAARIRAVGARVPARAVAEAVGAAHAAVAVLPARAAARVCAEAQREVRRPVHGDGA